MSADAPQRGRARVGSRRGRRAADSARRGEADREMPLGRPALRGNALEWSAQGHRITRTLMRWSQHYGAPLTQGRTSPLRSLATRGAQGAPAQTAVGATSPASTELNSRAWAMLVCTSAIPRCATPCGSGFNSASGPTPGRRRTSS